MFPEVRKHAVASAFLATLAVVFFARRADADFSGPYAVPHRVYQAQNLPADTQVGAWNLHQSGFETISYGAGIIQTDSTGITFDTGATLDHSFSPSLDWQFTNTIPATGILSFDYSLSLQATGPASGWNYGGYLLDGVLVKLPAGTGFIVVPVQAGGIFGFEAYASVNCVTCPPPFDTAGATTLTIMNFSGPVPEPSTIELLLSGAAGFAVIRHKSKLRR
jgi:hypothetical protein